MQYDPNLILTETNRATFLGFLESRGYQPAQLAVMSNVALVNAYHDTVPDGSSDIQRATSTAILTLLESLPGGVPNETIIRHIAADEARKIVENLPSRKLEVILPNFSTTIDGSLHYQTPLVIKIAAIGHPIMLVGPAGCGKTTIGEHVAKALSLQFYITNTITDTHELIGFIDGYGNYHSTPFRQAFENGGVWIADEIDAWEAGALLTANSALANGYCMFPDQQNPIYRHTNFKMIATANTFGTGADRIYVGRNELDAASLDRFATITVDYDLDLERLFAGEHDKWLDHVWNIRKQVNEMRIRHVISSRAISMGSTALSVGIDWSTCEELYLFKGMSQRDRDKLE
jgi:hypothetical protein